MWRARITPMDTKKSSQLSSTANAPVVSEQAVVLAGRGSQSRDVPKWLMRLTFCCLLLLLCYQGVRLNHPFREWGDAQLAVIARNYGAQGFFSNRMVPIQNNPLFGSHPDAYLHWPPLPPMILGVAFRRFGFHDLTARIVMLALLLANAATLTLLVRRFLGSREACFALSIFCLLPVNLQYGGLNTPQNWVNLCILLALYCFLGATESSPAARNWSAAGIGMVFAGVFMSWEALLLPIGLWSVAHLRRNRIWKRLAARYFAAALSAFTIILLHYSLAFPHLMEDLGHTLIFRMGFTQYESNTFDLYTLVNTTHYNTSNIKGTLKELMVAYYMHVRIIGPVLLLVPTGFYLLWKKKVFLNDRHLLLFAGLLAPGLLWYVLVVNQARQHNFMTLLFVPFLCAFGGWTLTSAGAVSSSRFKTIISRAVVSVSFCYLGVGAVSGIFSGIANYSPYQDWLIRYARDIRAVTDSQAVIMSPYDSLLGVYYSERHTVRGIRDDLGLEKHLAFIQQEFGARPLFLALRSDDTKSFARAIQRYPVAKQTPELLLLRLNPVKQPADGASQKAGLNKSTAGAAQ